MSQQINLLTANLRPRRDLVRGDKVLAVAALALLLVAAATMWASKEAGDSERVAAQRTAQLKQAREKLAALAKDLSGRKPDSKLAAELFKAKAELKGREEVMSYLQGGALSSQGFAPYLRSLARQASNGLWLTGFAVADGGHDMEIRGRMLQASALPDYIHRLNAEAAFQGRSFAALDIRRPEAEKSKTAAAGAPPKYVEFALTTNLPNTPATVPPAGEKKP